MLADAIVQLGCLRANTPKARRAKDLRLRRLKNGLWWACGGHETEMGAQLTWSAVAALAVRADRRRVIDFCFKPPATFKSSTNLLVETLGEDEAPMVG